MRFDRVVCVCVCQSFVLRPVSTAPAQQGLLRNLQGKEMQQCKLIDLQGVCASRIPSNFHSHFSGTSLIRLCPSEARRQCSICLRVPSWIATGKAVWSCSGRT